MAKKSVGKIKSHEKGMAKVIVSIKSPKTGAYTFKASMHATEDVDAFIKEMSK